MSGGSYLVAFAIVVLIGGLTGFFVGIVIDLIAGTKHVNMWWPAGGAIAFGVSSCTGASWHAFKEWRTGRRYAREPAEYRRGAGSRH
jgi:hypothetical protein